MDWICPSQRTPANGERVLAVDQHGEVFVATHYSHLDDGLKVWCDGERDRSVSWWMVLPPAP